MNITEKLTDSPMLLRQLDPVVIYGAGNRGIDMGKKLFEAGIRIAAFCDLDIKKWGRQLSEQTFVISPYKLIEKYKYYKKIYIVACIPEVDEVYALFRELGTDNIEIITYTSMRDILFSYNKIEESVIPGAFIWHSDKDASTNRYAAWRAMKRLEEESGAAIRFTWLSAFDTKKKIPTYENIDDVAVVMQGPIRYENRFTINTLRFYRSIYPKVLLIVSTWTGEVSEAFRQECEELNITIIENEYPFDPGFHANYQIVSTLSGIRHAKKFSKIKYVLKIRTDIRLYRCDFLLYMKNMVKAYPCKAPFNNRILFLGGGGISFSYYPFRLGDFLYFGQIDDMEHFFDIPICTWNINEGLPKELIFHCFEEEYLYELTGGIEHVKNEKWLEVMEKAVLPAVYISQCGYEKNIKRLGSDYKNRMGEYYDLLQNYAVIVDEQDLLFYFPKYDFHRHGAVYRYEFMTNYSAGGSLDHAKWLDIYLNWNGEELIKS